MNLTIDEVSWRANEADLKHIRFEVFVAEQNVPLEEEWDGQDPSATHFLARIDGNPIGTVRLMPDGQITRMAVLEPYREQGIGSALLHAAIAKATADGHETPYLHAQVQVISFYEAHGFVPHGEVFLDAGIRHMAMTYQAKGG